MDFLRWLWRFIFGEPKVSPVVGVYGCPETCGGCTCLRDHRPCPGCPCVPRGEL